MASIFLGVSELSQEIGWSGACRTDSERPQPKALVMYKNGKVNTLVMRPPLTRYEVGIFWLYSILGRRK